MENSSERKGKPRVRSDAQLARKRSVDRLHHQAKRVKEKNQLDIIEDGTAQIQESLRKLMEEVRQLNYALQGPGASPDTFSTPLQPAPLSGTDAIGSTTELERRGSPLTESAQIRDVAHRFLNTRSLPSLHPSIADNVYAAQEPGADWAPADYIAVACRCDNPPSHETESQCFELATYTFLLRAHKSLSKGEKSLRDLPLTPSIANMLLLQNENPIAITLNSAFRHNPSMLNLPSTVAAYFLMFLLLRWRAHPDAEANANLPLWLYPTAIQTSIPHPLSIDYLPWPALRDHLTQNQGKDPRQTVKLYLQSTYFEWPETRSFLSKGAQDQVVLEPDFVSAAHNLQNWKVTKAWAEEFPSLVRLVNVQDA